MQITRNVYNSANRLGMIQHPDNNQTLQEYFPTGQLKKTYGTRTYPVEYAYDSLGRLKTMTTMTTWQGFKRSNRTAGV